MTVGTAGVTIVETVGVTAQGAVIPCGWKACPVLRHGIRSVAPLFFTGQESRVFNEPWRGNGKIKTLDSGCRRSGDGGGRRFKQASSSRQNCHPWRLDACFQTGIAALRAADELVRRLYPQRKVTTRSPESLLWSWDAEKKKSATVSRHCMQSS